MGSQSSTISATQADRPFPLIVSPRSKRGNRDLSKESGAFASANEMVLIHNCIIRSLNCIYLQAPNISSPIDVSDFLEYMHAWSLLLHEHHDTEETVAFPLLEAYIQKKGFLDANLEQHRAFGVGLERFDTYVKGCQEGREKYDGTKVLEIVDSFGAILTQHLSDEIESLLRLEEFSDKIPWAEYRKKVLKKAVDGGNPELEIPCLITNMENHTEDGIHDSVWPPMPWFVLSIFRWWYIPKHKGAWRFSSCDSYGNPKKLPFA